MDIACTVDRGTRILQLEQVVGEEIEGDVQLLEPLA